MLTRIYRSWGRRLITYLLLVNFINLTANFYHSSVMDSSLLVNHDPIDSLAELVLEFVFDMDDETIPDTEVPHEKKKFSDIKLHFEIEELRLHAQVSKINPEFSDFYLNIFHEIKQEIHSPPPQLL